MLVIWILLAPWATFGLKIYESTVPIGYDESISGLHYKKSRWQENMALSNSLTTCLRFKFKWYSFNNFLDNIDRF